MKLILIMLICLLIISCGVDSTEIGADFFPDGRLDVSMVDSATVNLSTVLIENVSTNGKKRVVVGSHSDPQLGRISASAFLQFGISRAISLPSTDVDYESLQLVLKNDGYFFYDTTSLLSFGVHEVTDALQPDEDGRLYSSDQFGYSENPIASVNIYARPGRTEEYELALSDDLGQLLFEKATQAHADLSTNPEFIQFLKGLALVPDKTASSAMLGLDTEIEMRLYYRDRSVVPAQRKFISFAVNSSNSFTHLEVDREGTALDILDEPSARLPAGISDDQAFIQGGSSLALRIDLPYLRNFKQRENFYLTKAVLQFSPARKSYNGMLRLPDNLLAFRADETNEVYNTSPFQVELVTDYSLERDTWYSLDVTAFVKEQMELVSRNQNGLLFIFNEADFNVSRLCVAGPSSLNNTKLKIYYATINE